MFNFLKFLKPLYYELMSNFVIEKIKYDIEGECCKCGDCCRFMYCMDTYTEKEFKLMTFFYPKYKRFKIIGKDEYGNLILACKLIDEYNLCPDYENRLEMCKDYPNIKRIKSGGTLYKRCTYKINPQNSFKSYLTEKI